VSLLPDCEVYITDWHNARDIPVSEGKFDIEDYTLYLVEFMKYMGPQTHVIAVCQPAPLTLAATAYLAEEDPAAQPRTLTLIGGPIDPDATPTDVTDFGNRVTMGQLEQSMIQRVGFKYKGVGRKVYPGLLQLSSFISMNAETHARAFSDQISRVAKGEAGERDKHNKFYDEYLSVMDMTAEFYLSTVDRIFKGLEIAKNEFVVAGKRIDIGKITDVAVKTVEGENDDISAPGQCVAALDLCTGLPDSKKAFHLEPGAGHYGIFAGKSWRNNIRPLVLNFIDQNSGPRSVGGTQAKPKTAPKPATKPAPKKAKAG
jgi:poly(3-hydroxybutyrate) depolymerase